MGDIEIACALGERIRSSGGRAYFVGGYVRDLMMGAETKDVDLEVYGIPPLKLRELLAEFGSVLEKGASFGVLSLRHTNLDVAMPRTESRTGARHTDFDVSVDPYLSTVEASRRRDFTINAMMMDAVTGEIVDHWGGQRDLEALLIRHVSDDTFQEDALRVFRAAQFAARLNATIADETVALCAKMDVSNLSRERVFEELSKALLKSDRPSVFFEILEKCGHLSEFFPEVAALIGVGQNPGNCHPENDVFGTMLVVDAAAGLRNRAKEPLNFMLAALCHDLGKVDATEVRTTGQISSPMHPVTGRPLAERPAKTAHRQRAADPLRRQHGRAAHAPERDGDAPVEKRRACCSTRRGYCPEDLILLSRADATGKKDRPYDERLERFLWDRLEDYRECVSRPMVAGQDLIDAGLAPGEDFKLLARARRRTGAGRKRRFGRWREPAEIAVLQPASRSRARSLVERSLRRSASGSRSASPGREWPSGTAPRRWPYKSPSKSSTCASIVGAPSGSVGWPPWFKMQGSVRPSSSAMLAM